jgi:hypothetical protein
METSQKATRDQVFTREALPLRGNACRAAPRLFSTPVG